MERTLRLAVILIVVGGGIILLLDIAWSPCYCDIMIQSFKDRATEDIFNGRRSRVALRCCPQGIWRVAGRKLDQLDSVTTLEELRVPPGNRLERLSGDLRGQCSIRINEKYRLCFCWTDKGPTDVVIVDYH